MLNLIALFSKRTLIIILMGLLSLMLSSCIFLQSGNIRVCPKVSLLNQAGRMTQYKNTSGRDLVDVLFEARLEDIHWVCSFIDNSLSVVATINLVARKGPTFEGDMVKVPFFVAVIDQDHNIIAKKQFESEIEFIEGHRRGVTREEIEQVIFLEENKSGTDYEVIVGLQLKKDQLQQNRSLRF